MADISDSEDLEAWLKGKSPELAYILATRAALRAAPALGWALHEEEEDRRCSVVLTSFRTLAAASFAGAWPSRAAEIRNIARSGGRDARDSVSDVFNAAQVSAFEAKDGIPEMHEVVRRLEEDASALGVATNAVEAAVHAVQGVVDAVDATSGVASPKAVFESTVATTIAACDAIDGVNGGSQSLAWLDEEAGEEIPVAAHIGEFWEAVEQDATFLQAGMDAGRELEELAAALSQEALWPGGIPVWAGRQWADLKDELPDDEGWSVWLDWYEDHLTGRAADEALEFERVTIPNEAWKQGPAYLNAILQEMTTHRRDAVNAETGQGVQTTPPTERYFAPDDPERSVTTEGLKRLGRKTQIAYLVHWFRGMFEDPANETPYESREGGYQYVWGGPYEARDEFDREFGGFVPGEVIDAAVSEVERTGTMNWAPGPNHPNQKARMEEAMANDHEPPPTTLEDIRDRLAGGVTPQFGDSLEAGCRASLRNEIARLRDLTERDAPVHGGIGHNRPPEHLALSVELTVEVKQTIEEIDAEVAKPAPNVEAVVESTSRLKKVLAWMGDKLDKSVDAFLTKYWSTLGIAAALGTTGVALSPVGEWVGRVFNAALEWLDAVTLAF